MSPGEFAAVAVALFAAHQVADHIVQTDYQARTKGAPGWVGRLACARHVVTYTATAAAALGALWLVLGLRLPLWQTAAGLLVSAVSHYIADRREPLRRFALAIGLTGFWALGTPRPGRDDNPSLGTGAYAIDQAWHHGWLFITALIIAT